MNEKPPILSEDDFESAISSRRICIVASPTYHKIIATRQRDADVAYYEPIIQQARKPKTRIIDITRAKKKVRQDTAREIIELVRKEVKFSLRRQLTKMPSVKEQQAVSEDLENRLNESLKDKWLKGSK